MNTYQQRIREGLANFIEAWMRLEHGTLDHLSPNAFRAEVASASQCADAATSTENAALVASYGLDKQKLDHPDARFGYVIPPDPRVTVVRDERQGNFRAAWMRQDTDCPAHGRHGDAWHAPGHDSPTSAAYQAWLFQPDGDHEAYYCMVDDLDFADATVPPPYIDPFPATVTCAWCGGTGVLTTGDPCDECAGSGEVRVLA